MPPIESRESRGRLDFLAPLQDFSTVKWFVSGGIFGGFQGEWLGDHCATCGHFIPRGWRYHDCETGESAAYAPGTDRGFGPIRWVL